MYEFNKSFSGLHTSECKSGLNECRNYLKSSVFQVPTLLRMYKNKYVFKRKKKFTSFFRHREN